MMTRIVNGALALSLVVATGASVSSKAQRPRQNDPEVLAAMRDGGLRAASRVSGGEYVGVTEWATEVACTMESLVKLSGVVLIGEVSENLSHLSASGDYITTDYRMKVQRSLKGNVAPHAEVVFQVMGGKVVFEDGSSAVIETKGFARPRNRARVVIFADVFPNDDRLMPPAVLEYARGAQVFRLVGMGRGVVELPTDDTQRVWMNALGANDPASRRLKSLSVRDFIAELETAVEKATKGR